MELKPMIKEQIAACCKTLKLSQNIADNFESIEAENRYEFLLKILQNEVEYRKVKKIERLIKQAKFYTIKTFEGYSFDEIRIPSGLSNEDLKTGTFIEKKENLILYGAAGTGKSHLATAIGLEACRQRKSVLFFRTATLVNQLSKAKEEGKLDKIFKKIEKADLIICDEWGYIPIDTQGTRLLFEVIAECYEKRSVIITTNIEFGKWNNIFYDEKITTAIIDRLVHHGHLLLFTGESYRLKNSMIKKQGK